METVVDGKSTIDVSQAGYNDDEEDFFIGSLVDGES